MNDNRVRAIRSGDSTGVMLSGTVEQRLCDSACAPTRGETPVENLRDVLRFLEAAETFGVLPFHSL